MNTCFICWKGVGFVLRVTSIKDLRRPPINVDIAYRILL